MEKQINDLSWGFELYDTFTLSHGIFFTLKAAGDHPIRFNHLYALEKFQDNQRLLQCIDWFTRPENLARYKIDIYNV